MSMVKEKKLIISHLFFNILMTNLSLTGFFLATTLLVICSQLRSYPLFSGLA